jgi:ABC-2 type transport system permease protein
MTGRLIADFARPFLSTLLMDLKRQAVTPWSYVQLVVQPVIISAIGLALFSSTGHAALLPYAVIGGGLVGLWSVTLFNAGYSIHSERWSGTLELILGCPTALSTIVAGKIIANIGLGTLSFISTAVIALIGFSGMVSRMNVLGFAIWFVLTLAAFFSMALLLAPFFAWLRMTSYAANAFEIPLYIVCGFMFPIAHLPGWVQPLSWLFPPTWTIQGMMAMAVPTNAGLPLIHWATYALALMAVYMLASLYFFRVVSAKARVNGEASIA